MTAIHAADSIKYGDNNSLFGIARVTGDITYSEFFEKYMVKNVPCIFSEVVTESWLSRKLWVKNHLPNFEYLRENFGKTVAPVANCNESYFGSQKKTDMSIGEFLCYWEKFISKNYPADMPVLYLKDWHLKQNYPDSNYYKVPQYFASDWLNEFWTKRDDVCDDYRFVYMGPKGSWTPEHEDVFSSYSWSANVIGQKRWVFYPPSHDKTNGFSCQHRLMSGGDAMGVEEKPKMEVIQETGEVIFVPSGWRHEVWNLKDTISINHNWANACNVESWIWPSLSSALSAVETELKDCLEDGMESWEEECQLLLRATHGMDFMEFYSFLSTISEPRMHFLLSHHKYLIVRSLLEHELEPGCVDLGSINTPCSSSSGEVQAPVEACEKQLKEVIELQLPGERPPEAVNFNGPGKEMQGMPFSGNDLYLGPLHAVFDLWCIHRVLQGLLSHPSISKLKFFQEMMTSQSHLKFWHKLQVLIQHADASGDLKFLQRFS